MKNHGSVLLALTMSAALLTGSTACAQSAPASPATTSPAIERECEACIEKDSSTAGMVECIDQAYKKWDAELNRVYGQLMGQYSDKQKKALKAAQLQWIKFRDAQFASMDAVFAELEGTMYVPMQAEARKSVVRGRAEQLQRDLEFWQENRGSAGETK